MAKYEIEMIVAGTPIQGGMNPHGQNSQNPWGGAQQYGMGMGMGSYYGAMGSQMGMMNPQYLQQAAYMQQPYAQMNSYYEAASTYMAQSAAYAAAASSDGRYTATSHCPHYIHNLIVIDILSMYVYISICRGCSHGSHRILQGLLAVCCVLRRSCRAIVLRSLVSSSRHCSSGRYGDTGRPRRCCRDGRNAGQRWRRRYGRGDVTNSSSR